MSHEPKTLEERKVEALERIADAMVDENGVSIAELLSLIARGTDLSSQTNKDGEAMNIATAILQGARVVQRAVRERSDD